MDDLLRSDGGDVLGEDTDIRVNLSDEIEVFDSVGTTLINHRVHHFEGFKVVSLDVVKFNGYRYSILTSFYKLHDTYNADATEIIKHMKLKADSVRELTNAYDAINLKAESVSTLEEGESSFNLLAVMDEKPKQHTSSEIIELHVGLINRGKWVDLSKDTTATSATRRFLPLSEVTAMEKWERLGKTPSELALPLEDNTPTFAFFHKHHVGEDYPEGIAFVLKKYTQGSDHVTWVKQLDNQDSFIPLRSSITRLVQVSLVVAKEALLQHMTFETELYNEKFHRKLNSSACVDVCVVANQYYCYIIASSMGLNSHMIVESQRDDLAVQQSGFAPVFLAFEAPGLGVLPGLRQETDKQLGVLSFCLQLDSLPEFELRFPAVPEIEPIKVNLAKAIDCGENLPMLTDRSVSERQRNFKVSVTKNNYVSYVAEAICSYNSFHCKWTNSDAMLQITRDNVREHLRTEGQVVWERVDDVELVMMCKLLNEHDVLHILKVGDDFVFNLWSEESAGHAIEYELRWGLSSRPRRPWEPLATVANSVGIQADNAMSSILACVLNEAGTYRRLELKLPMADQKCFNFCVKKTWVLENRSEWLKDGDHNFVFDLRDPSCQPAERNIFEDSGEINHDSWSLMHRMNEMKAWIEEYRDDSCVLTYILVQSRLNNCGILDWQRHYNSKPRDVAWSIRSLADTMSGMYSTLCPSSKYFFLHIRANLSNGDSNNGHNIRDYILKIMHQFHIKEVKELFTEQWHQKLHNNATRDDIFICEALIEFLKSNGDIAKYWYVLRQHNISRERMAAYERPITLQPTMPHCDIGGLIAELEYYKTILISVHGNLQMPAAARDQLAKENTLETCVKLLCSDDLTLACSIIEAFNIKASQDQLDQHTTLRLLLQLLRHLGPCDRELVSNLAKDFAKYPEWLEAHVERLQKIFFAANETFENRSHDAMSFLIENGYLVEAVKEQEQLEYFLRSTLSFGINALLRKAQSNKAVRIVSAGHGTASGHLLCVNDIEEFENLAEKSDSSHVLIVKQLRGEQDIPANVVAVVTDARSSTVDMLSHIAIRARNTRIILMVVNSLPEYQPGRFVECTATQDPNKIFKDVDQKACLYTPSIPARDVVLEFATELPDPIQTVDKPLLWVGSKTAGLHKLAALKSELFRVPTFIAIRQGFLELQVPHESGCIKKTLMGNEKMREIFALAETTIGSTVDFERKFITGIAAVYDSVHKKRPRTELAKFNIPLSHVRMGVLIQKCIKNEFCFVLHSQNPMGGEGMYGQLAVGFGENLVGSSMGDPLTFTRKSKTENATIEDFPSKFEGLVVSDEDSWIFRSDSNSEDLGDFAGAGLFESVPTSVNPQKFSYASHELFDGNALGQTLNRLGDIAFEIAEKFGFHVDIEGVIDFAKVVYVVQARAQIL